MKVGYIHYDGMAEIGRQYRRGSGIKSKFDPNFMREGGPNATRHIFGTDTFPLHSDFDYRQVDCDLVYFWLQGGVGSALPALRKFREESDAVFVLFFDDVYWLDTQRLYHLESWRSTTNLMDVLTSGYIDDHTRISTLKKPWRYLPYPHDIDYLRQFFRKEPKEKSFFSMVHGRLTLCRRTLKLYSELHKKFPDWKFRMHPYRFCTEEQILSQWNFGDHHWLEFTPIADDWFKLLGEQRIMIDEYPSLSQSQVATQAACLGTPTISHIYNSPNKICFPTLTFDINNLESWFKVACRLVKDDDFYNQVQEYAYEAVEDYSFNNFEERLLNIYKEFKK